MRSDWSPRRTKGLSAGPGEQDPTRELAAKSSQRFASMTTAGNLTVAAHFNYQRRLELEFAPHRFIERRKAGPSRARGRTRPRLDNRVQAAHSNNANITATIAQKIAKRTGKPRQL